MAATNTVPIATAHIKTCLVRFVCSLSSAQCCMLVAAGGYSGSGELPAPRYVVDEAGNLLYEYDAAYVDAR